MEIKSNQVVDVQYTNWKGITAIRRILPKRLFFGENEYHPGGQWLLECVDLDKQAERVFAMKDIHGWEPTN